MISWLRQLFRSHSDSLRVEAERRERWLVREVKKLERLREARRGS